MYNNIDLPSDSTIVALGWQDLCGITRVRGFPLNKIEKKSLSGLGFPACGQALTITGGIAANRWGPIDDVRQLPAISTLVQIPRNHDYPGFNLVLADTVDDSGKPFECCTRNLLKSALNDLKNETGFEFATALEHEFTLLHEDFKPQLCMTLDALRDVDPLPELLLWALNQAGIQMEAFEPEFGSGQYELSCSHLWGIEAIDKAIVTREIVRDIARHCGFRATFSPKVAPDQVGNGAHIHFSLKDEKNSPVLYDDKNDNCLSEVGNQFVAGVIHHINSIIPFAASSPLSYMRLGPGKWSSGSNAFGPGNREAVIRICDLPMLEKEARANSFNLEFRAADNCCNPYLVMTMIVRAGLRGILEHLPVPPAISVDPVTLTDTERDDLGIRPLPVSFEESLSSLENDETAKSWLPEALLETFLTMKRNEISEAKDMSDDELCAHYASIY